MTIVSGLQNHYTDRTQYETVSYGYLEAPTGVLSTKNLILVYFLSNFVGLRFFTGFASLTLNEER